MTLKKYWFFVVLMCIYIPVFSQKYSQTELMKKVSICDTISYFHTIIDSVESNEIIHYEINAYYIKDVIVKIEYCYFTKTTFGYDKYYYNLKGNLIYYYNNDNGYETTEIKYFSKYKIKILRNNFYYKKRKLLKYTILNSNYFKEHFN